MVAPSMFSIWFPTNGLARSPMRSRLILEGLKQRLIKVSGFGELYPPWSGENAQPGRKLRLPRTPCRSRARRDPVS